jgi:hypothetical protein
MKSNTNNGTDTSNSQSQLPSFHRTQSVSIYLKIILLYLKSFLQDETASSVNHTSANAAHKQVNSICIHR